MSILAALVALDPYQRANSVPELMAWPDVDFVRCAYVTLLGRQPEAAGETYYADLLRRGVSKWEVLWRIRRSAEGRSHDPGIAGLDRQLRRHRNANLPFLGAVVRAFTRQEGDSSAERRFRALENQLSAAMLEQDRAREKKSRGAQRIAELQSAFARQVAASSELAADAVRAAMLELKEDFVSQYQALQLGVDLCRAEAARRQDITAIQEVLSIQLGTSSAETIAQCRAVEQNVMAELQSLAKNAAMQSRLDAFEMHLGSLVNAQIEIQGALRSRMDDSLALARASELQSSAVMAQVERVAAATSSGTELTASLSSQLPGLREVIEALRMEQALLLERTTRIDRSTSHQLLVSNKQILLTTDVGFVVLPDDDPVLFVVVRHMNGVLEPGTVAVIRHLLDEGDTIVDVGAHVGLITLIAARKVGVGGRVIAVEPVARSADALETMLRVNFIENVELRRCAAGSAAGTAQINVGRILGHSSLLPLDESSESAKVDVRTVDQLVPAGTQVKLVKLDVEGFELECLHGMERLFAENPTMGIVAEFGPSHLKRAHLSISDWLGAFEAKGFEAWEIDEVSGQLSRPRSERRLAAIHSINFLFWRGDKRVLESIVEADKE